MSVADANANSAENQPLAVSTGQSNGVGGMTADVVVYNNGGMLVIIWNDAEDKLLGMPRAIFVGEPSRLRQPVELSNWKKSQLYPRMSLAQQQPGLQHASSSRARTLPSHARKHEIR